MHRAKNFATVGLTLGFVCLCGVLSLRGQESRAPSDGGQAAQQSESKHQAQPEQGRQNQQAPQMQQPTIKSDVRIVLVDVVVTGAKGQPAGGLKKEDFQVSEDGKAQTVSFFEEHTDGKVTPVALPEMPPGVYTNYPTVKTTDSVNVLLLDSLNTQAIDQSYVRPQMEKYMEAAIASPHGARLAIFTLGQQLRMIRGFTADSAKSLEAMKDPNSHTEAKFEPQVASPLRKEREAALCGQKAPIAIEACKGYVAGLSVDRAADRIGMTLQAFQALARYLAPIPGRKNIMWVAGSFPIHFFPDTGRRGEFKSPYPNEVRQTAELLTADQVAVYPISATGVGGESYLQATNGDPNANRTGKAVADDEADRSFNQIGMELLARDTGGHAFYNTNGLSEAMEQAVEEGSHFYSLAYVPSNSKMDGKFRKIDLKVSGGDYRLAYRRGYYAENAKFLVADADRKRSDALLPLMGLGMPDFAQVLYKLKVAPVADAGGVKESKEPSARYALDFAITPTDLHLAMGPDGKRRGNIEFMAAAFDADGNALKMERKKSEIVLEPQMYAEVMRVGLQMHREIDVPENAAYLRTGIMDLETGKMGSLTIEMRSKEAKK
jgi:VWFA-related protein